MPRVVCATEAKNRLASPIGWVVDHGDEVIVESQGKPRRAHVLRRVRGRDGAALGGSTYRSPGTAAQCESEGERA